MSRRPQGELRRGWTTGACATAATKAALWSFWAGETPNGVVIDLPRGGTAEFAIAEYSSGPNWREAAVTKDAGDDPDVTHGALIKVRVSAAEAGQGVCFRAGRGVGTVTLPGLQIPPGEPAINPVPRQMITKAVKGLATNLGRNDDVIVEISIPGGETLAQSTLNGRLGIVGGLSILGTTGVVIPYSCASWIHSIHRGIDVARAAGLEHVAATTGSMSEQTVRQRYALPDNALLDMGDFAGGTLKYLKRHPIPKLTLAGGFAKLTKLAQGHLDLHSSRSSVDLNQLADWLGEIGGEALMDQVRTANTANQVLALAEDKKLPLASLIAERSRVEALRWVGADVAIEAMIVDRKGNIVGHADGW